MKAYIKNSSGKGNKLTGLLVIAFFLLSCCAIHVVHKHCPLKAATPGKYDAACHWVKTDKAGKSAITTAATVFIQAFCLATILYLFLIGTVSAENEILKTFFPASFHFSRAPPYSFFR